MSMQNALRFATIF